MKRLAAILIMFTWNLAMAAPAPKTPPKQGSSLQCALLSTQMLVLGILCIEGALPSCLALAVAAEKYKRECYYRGGGPFDPVPK